MSKWKYELKLEIAKRTWDNHLEKQRLKSLFGSLMDEVQQVCCNVENEELRIRKSVVEKIYEYMTAEDFIQITGLSEFDINQIYFSLTGGICDEIYRNSFKKHYSKVESLIVW